MNSYKIELDHTRHLVKITANGELLQSDGEAIITNARKQAAENNYNILYDMRNAITKVKFASWYHMPRKLDVFKDMKSRNVKAAIVVSNTDPALSEYKFYENVTQNLGFNLKVFLDEAEAIKWLDKNSGF